ncbi:MAG: 4Fe-4S binding protein [Candidatus Atribacteria bacterium]|nr:4Fe-4S binding protein [Candidatus Atribacteria bacterium]
MPRIKTIEIEEAKCTGCGQCVLSCHEGVIALRDGKARVVKESLCDGLGSCIPACPQGAIHFVEKDISTCPNAESKKDLKWPVQLRLISPLHRFPQKDLVIAADCTAFAFPGFHELLGNRRVLIGCPKFDDPTHSSWALQTILESQTFESLEVILMEVPCCLGLRYLVEDTLEKATKHIAFTSTILGVDGTIKKQELIRPRE